MCAWDSGQVCESVCVQRSFEVYEDVSRCVWSIMGWWECMWGGSLEV